MSNRIGGFPGNSGSRLGVLCEQEKELGPRRTNEIWVPFLTLPGKLCNLEQVPSPLWFSEVGLTT